MIRTGIGFDTHRFAENRALVLGGVRIPHPVGLLGHSDADVLVHAIIDAILGAVAAGDIGRHFPDTEARWKDADSLRLLEESRRIAERHGMLRIVNVDATVIAQAPRLAPHVETMRSRLAEALGVTTDRVSVKATTAEHMGALGRGEGIASMAVATLDVREA